MENQIKEKIKSTRELVSNILTHNPNARNNDWELLFLALKEKGIKLPSWKRKQIMESGINFHTLLRERQKLQSEGLFLPTNPEVLKRRKRAEEVYREHYSQN